MATSIDCKELRTSINCGDTRCFSCKDKLIKAIDKEEVKVTSTFVDGRTEDDLKPGEVKPYIDNIVRETQEEETVAPITPPEPKKEANSVGRPTKLTPEVRKKIEEMAELDASVEEMAYYCDISKVTIYQWFKEDPEFSNYIDRLRERPVYLARNAIVKAIKENPDHAFKYLSKKRRVEFGDKQEIDLNHSGSISLTDLFDKSQKDKE